MSFISFPRAAHGRLKWILVCSYFLQLIEIKETRISEARSFLILP